MNNRSDENRREKIGLRFISALDDGDLDVLAALWEEAAADEELGRLFCELTDSIYEEAVASSRLVGNNPLPPVDRESAVPGAPTMPVSPRSPSVPMTGGTLVLSRKLGQKIVIGDNITVSVVKIQGTQVRLGVSAPTNISVHRQEVHEAMGRDLNPLEQDMTFREE